MYKRVPLIVCLKNRSFNGKIDCFRSTGIENNVNCKKYTSPEKVIPINRQIEPAPVLVPPPAYDRSFSGFGLIIVAVIVLLLLN